MKQVALGSIRFYQRFLSPLLKQLFGVQAMCRFSPTCSDYALEHIKKYGIVKGSWLSFIRLVNCQPFSTTYGKHL